MMSQALRDALFDSGWSPTRHTPTAEWIANLTADGFQAIPEAEEIIASFGGLTLRSVPLGSAVYQPPVVFFDPITPGGQGDVDRIPDWERRLHIKLNPIADLSAGHATLLLASDGRVFAAMDGMLYLYGESFEDALENTLVFGRRIPQKAGELSEGDI
jgi:hypothetical protein